MPCHVACPIRPGLIDTERVAEVPTITGVPEHVTVWHTATTPTGVHLDFIGAVADEVLVEFPREADSGSWRAWVPKEYVTD
jgi:hypothetical protein